MANCTLCGSWAGVGQTVCSPTCPPVPAARVYRSGEDELVERFRPLIMKAARAAGIAAALAICGITLGIAIVYAIARSL